MKKLKPCPFCGTVPTLPEKPIEGDTYKIQCRYCGQAHSCARISLTDIPPMFSSTRYVTAYVKRALEVAESRAITAWNTRHNEEEE